MRLHGAAGRGRFCRGTEDVIEEDRLQGACKGGHALSEETRDVAVRRELLKVLEDRLGAKHLPPRRVASSS
eukprot:760660-Hanusia_phi.AAC.5